MHIEGRRRSENFEDRGRGEGGGGGGSLPVALLADVVQSLGLRGSLIVAAALGLGYVFMPSGLRRALFGNTQGQGAEAARGAQGAGSACKVSATSARACDFPRAVLASTEDVWKGEFSRGALPSYGVQPGAYQDPTLVVFSAEVRTGGCGASTSAVGPFYCGRDRKLYLDPSFYDMMTRRFHAPGDFAQAYVIAHEVGHHVQNLIGSSRHEVRGETQNQVSVRVELQADCLAGVWGHTARSSLKVNDDDLREALTAAHAIGDDALGHSNAAEHTHGTSAQRMRWFKRGLRRR